MTPSELAGLDDKYEILAKLREGGMGAVYKVRHRLLEETRVVKVIRPQLESDEDLRRRFLGEARSAVRLRHPNVAQIYDFTVDADGTSVMVMEFIDGRDLGELLRLRGRLSVDLLLEVALQSLRALSYLHRNEFVHRDISPDNIMLTQDVDGEPLVKLIDLGIAKRLGASLALTGTGLFLGKLRYASPEQFGASGVGSKLDQRSDLYSLAVALYELATGSHPIAGDSSEALVAGHLFHPPRPFSETDPGRTLPEGLRDAILRALAKDPAERFPNAIAFGDALTEVKAGWVEPEPETTRLEMTLIAPRADDPTLLAPERGGDDPEALLADLRQRVDELLREGRLADAERAVEGAPGEALGPEALEPLRQRLQELRSTVEEALAAARSHRESGDFAAARECLERVRAIERLHPEATALDAQIEAAEERRRRQAEEVRAQIRDLLDAGHLPEARRALSAATEVHGRSELFAQLERRIGEREAAQQARQQAIEELSRRVDELLSGARAASAEAEVGRLRGRYGDDPGFDELDRRIAARRALARARLEEATALVESGDLAAAARGVDEVLGIDRELPEALQLQSRIELGRQRQRLGAAEAGARIEAEIRAGDLAAAQGLLAAAEASFGGAEPLAGLRERLERLRAEHRSRRERLDAAVTHIEALLERGELEPARGALSEATAEYGSTPRLEDLGARLATEEERRREAAAREEEERRRERRRRVTALLREAREKVDSEDLAAATAALEQAQELEPGDPAIAALAEHVASARERAAMFPDHPAAAGGRPDGDSAPRRRRRTLLAAAAVLALVALAATLALQLRDHPAAPQGEPTEEVLSPAAALRQGLAGIELGRFRALVIGNNDYRGGLPRLRTAVPDAQALAEALGRDYGFEVELLTDATRETTLRALERMASSADETDNLLVFYAGHGFVDEVNARGYWQPVDAEPASTANWISSLEIGELLSDSAARRVLVIADSCFSGALLEIDIGTAAAPAGDIQTVRETATRRARLAITSGALQPVLDAGSGGHSVFSGALLEALGEVEPVDARGLHESLAARLQPMVERMGGEQTPRIGALETHQDGGFYLVPGGEL